MKPSPLDYVCATSVDHAVELLSSAADVRVLAGGQSLMPVLNLRLGAADILVDISRLDELRAIEIASDSATDAGGSIRIGAAVTQTEVAHHREVQDRWPMLAAAISQIGHPPIRNRGTVCGSLAHNDPQAELPAVAVALEAVVTAQSPRGSRSISADELFDGPFSTTLERDEIMTAVEFPAPRPNQGWSFREFCRQPGDFATAGVAVVLERDAGALNSRLVAFGLGTGPERATLIEEVLRNQPEPALDSAIIDEWASMLQPADDAHASAPSKIQHAKRLMREAVAEAGERMS